MPFVDAPTEIKQRCVLSVQGEVKCGKTHFGFTAPDPIGYLSFDYGEEGVIEPFAREKKIQVARYTIPNLPAFHEVGSKRKASDPATEKIRREEREKAEYIIMQEASEVWQAFKEDYLYALENFRTVIVDRGTDVYRLVRLMHFGRSSQENIHYEYVNSDMAWIIRKPLTGDYNCNAVWIHGTKTKYIGNVATNFMDLDGYKGVGGLVQAVLEARRDEDGKFVIDVLDSRHKPQLNGQSFTEPNNTFDCISGLILA